MEDCGCGVSYTSVLKLPDACQDEDEFVGLKLALASPDCCTSVTVPAISSKLEKPEPVVISFEDMTLEGTRYDNPSWLWFNPFMQLTTVAFLVNGVDYDLLPTGGFVLKGNVPAIYEGQTIQVYNYTISNQVAPVTPPPSNNTLSNPLPFIL